MGNIKLISQPERSHCCGQCCVAMAASVGLEEAKRAVGKNGCTPTKDLQKGLTALNMRPRGGKLKAIYGDISKLPETCILKVVSPRRRSGWHWVFKRRNKIYCPSRGVFQVAEYATETNSRITSYLEIFTDGRLWKNPKCTKKIGIDFTPETECPDELTYYRENGRIISVNCGKTCPHHIYYKKPVYIQQCGRALRSKGPYPMTIEQGPWPTLIHNIKTLNKLKGD